jgi:hypothetical protein
MTTYKIDYRWNGLITHVKGVVDADQLAEIQANPKHVIVSLEEYTPVIRYRTCEGCERCKTDEYVPHYNCIYQGRAMGHSLAHCTADACY